MDINKFPAFVEKTGKEFLAHDSRVVYVGHTGNLAIGVVRRPGNPTEGWAIIASTSRKTEGFAVYRARIADLGTTTAHAAGVTIIDDAFHDTLDETTNTSLGRGLVREPGHAHVYIPTSSVSDPWVTVQPWQEANPATLFDMPLIPLSH